MKKKTKEDETTAEIKAQVPLILRWHRLMEAFAKSDDERDFYVDRVEGFIVFVNLDKTQEELDKLYEEVEKNSDRYIMVPKLTFYETKKIMEGYVNEKVYDIDTKEKLLDIIQSKEARENFLEYIYDHHAELEKWQQYYQERSRIRIIEWLRGFHYEFVFEEDLDLPINIIEKLKETLFEKKVAHDVEVARKLLVAKSKSYYSSEALNPRPKRGRPPKQVVKLEMEPQVTTDIFVKVPACVRPFLFTPEISCASDVTFSSRFETQEELAAHGKFNDDASPFSDVDEINNKLAELRKISSGWVEKEKKVPEKAPKAATAKSPQPIAKTPPPPVKSKAKAVKEPAPAKATSAKAAPAKEAPKRAAPKKKSEKETPAKRTMRKLNSKRKSS